MRKKAIFGRFLTFYFKNSKLIEGADPQKKISDLFLSLCYYKGFKTYRKSLAQLVWLLELRKNQKKNFAIFGILTTKITKTKKQFFSTTSKVVQDPL